MLYAMPAREYAAPRADLEVSPLRGPAPLEVGFRDASIGAIRSFAWSFGDGGSDEGEDVAHVYEAPGRYRARLRVEGPGGASEKDVEIEVLPPDAAFAEFEGDPRKGRERVEVRFRNRSKNAKTYAWDFGDGALSSERDPVHVYEGAGIYTVRLRVTNDLGEDVRVREKYVKVAHPLEPLADFRAEPREGEAPLEVGFEDLSTGALSEWRWDLGDLLAGEGRIRRERNPVYVYRIPGWYTVRLRVAGPHGEDEVEKVRYIHVKEEGDGKGGGKSEKPMPPKAPKTPAPAGRDRQPPKGPPPKVQYNPVGVPHPDAPQDLVEKTQKIYQPAPPGTPGGPDAKPHEVVLPEYRRAAEDSIEHERIPPVLREHLRRYFDGLRPK
jgi:PKD repeat protein